MLSIAEYHHWMIRCKKASKIILFWCLKDSEFIQNNLEIDVFHVKMFCYLWRKDCHGQE